MESTQEQLQGVTLSQKLDGSWMAKHDASGRVAHGLDKDEAQAEMQKILGMDADGQFSEPLTSDMFEGTARDLALYLEGPISEMLALHSGFARLESYQDGLAFIRLGGGCQGCPSSRITLLNGVFKELQEQFGEDYVREVQPVLD